MFGQPFCSCELNSVSQSSKFIIQNATVCNSSPDYWFAAFVACISSHKCSSRSGMTKFCKVLWAITKDFGGVSSFLLFLSCHYDHIELQCLLNFQYRSNFFRLISWPCKLGLCVWPCSFDINFHLTRRAQIYATFFLYFSDLRLDSFASAGMPN